MGEGPKLGFRNLFSSRFFGGGPPSRPPGGRTANIFRRRKVKKEREKDIRTVKVGKDNSSGYPPNVVITSKYTFWNFVPKNLFEQFRRIANFYFLLITTISFIVDSPVGPLSSLLPLLFVVLVTAVKQGYEDYVRHRSDREHNCKVVWVLRNSCLQKIQSQKIKVGDIVKVCEEEDVPCDLVLLTSSHESSKCYVTTASLDGETSYKTMYCPKSLKGTVRKENMRHLEAVIECENPTPDLYKFNGRIEFGKITSRMIRRQSEAYRRQTSSLQDEVRSKRSPNLSHLHSSDGLGNGSLSNEILSLGRSKDSLSPVAKEEMKRSLKGALEEFPDGFELDFRSSSPQLGRSEAFRGGAERHLTLPKRSLQKHKKTFSDVTDLSWDPDSLINLSRTKWISKRRDSEKGNLVDPLMAENLLLKGSTLKNTEYIYGCAVYTGQETKMSLNSKLTRNKFSLAEKSINKLLMFQLGILLFQSIVATVLDTTIEITIGGSKIQPFFFADDDDELKELRDIFLKIFKSLFTFTMIYNYLVPISLYVTLEMTKFLGSLLFQWDQSIYDETTDQSALCNTSDLNEELGQVEYLFTDKTGTLTENNLRFHSCSISGIAYTEKDGELAQEGSESLLTPESFQGEVEIFLLALTLCNTVQVIVEKEEEFRYNATSPDEKALVEAMQRMGIVFANDDDFVVVNFAGKNRIFQKLEILEFSSSRKRMSVIVKDEEGNIRLYCKGAETSVIPKITSGPTQTTLRHVSDFAKDGLRTLVVGYKSLTEEEYNIIEEKVQKARETLSSGREEILAKTYEEIENDLHLLGATGVEDKLQEGVKDTLESLRAAGIKVWMLTGDKAETAVKISLSCGHFKSDMTTVSLTEIANEKDCEEAVDDIYSTVAENKTKEFGLVVDGTSLGHSLKTCPELFRELCVKCSAVVCCRLSPIQKSQVVNLVKKWKKSPITAAIGDGANDVPMIKEAHVGLGIMGKEGRQAVLCSDFAFAKFRFLKRALLVHGQWFYKRTADLIQYFFYKNVVFVLPQFYFFFFSGYSVQQLYDSFFFTTYNTVFTSLPVLIYGVFEQHYSKQKLLNCPALYKCHRQNILLSWKYFSLWMAFGVWHSLVVFFWPTLFYKFGGSEISLNCLEHYGTTVVQNVILVVNLKLVLHSRFWSVALIGSVILTILSTFLITLAYSSIHMPQVNLSFYFTFNRLVQSPNYWLLSIIIWVSALLPDFLMYIYLTRSRWESPCPVSVKHSTRGGSILQESGV